MLMRIWLGLSLSFMCFGVLAQTATPDPVIVKIQAMLAKPSVLCGRFDQTKQLIGMKKLLASNGRFCVVTGKGIIWRTLQPFPNGLKKVESTTTPSSKKSRPAEP